MWLGDDTNVVVVIGPEHRRFFTEAGSSGEGIDVPPIDRADFLAARANYYKVRGLDENGMPTRDKARQLNLPWND